MTDLNQIAEEFERFDLVSQEPKWSSWLLDQVFDTWLMNRRRSVVDILQGFNLALQRDLVQLTETVANLIRAVVIAGFVRDKSHYTLANWSWANDAIASGINSAQAYLFLSGFPKEQATPASLLSLLRGLAGTCRFDEALIVLADDIEPRVIELELQKWRTDGPKDQMVDQPREFLQNC